MAQSQYGTAQSSPGAVATPARHPPQIRPPPHPQAAGAATSGKLPQHKRVYQACIPCRRRKVRCDLGSVDNPHDPPCVRCRRESKECFFSATRRKRKTDDDEGSDADEYVARNGRKRLQSSGSPPARLDRRYFSDVPLTPGGSHGQTQPLRRPYDSARYRDGRGSELDGDGDGDANQTLENLEAQTVMRRGMYGPHDALDLLYKAATDRLVAGQSKRPLPEKADLTSPAADHRREGIITSNTPLPPPPAPAQDPATQNDPPPPSVAHAKHLQQAQLHHHHRQLGHVHEQQPQSQPQRQQPVDPELAQQQPALRSNPGYINALRAWSRFRFVRAGWFTAQEAIEYID